MMDLNNLALACMGFTTGTNQCINYVSRHLHPCFIVLISPFPACQSQSTQKKLFGGHLISMDIHPRILKGSYHYSLRLERILHLLLKSARDLMQTDIRSLSGSLPVLRNRHKNPSHLMPHDLHRFRFISVVHLVLSMGKAHRWGSSQNVGPDSAAASAQAPYFGNAPTLGLYPTQNYNQLQH